VAIGALIGGAIGDRVAQTRPVLPHAYMMIYASALQLIFFVLVLVMALPAGRRKSDISDRELA
jgi:hypothetical protein